MEKKVLSIIGAIVAFAGIVAAAYFIIERLLRKSGCCCEDVEFDNYVECPCDEDDDEIEDLDEEKPILSSDSDAE